MQEEIWKDVPGYEGLYQVSNFGLIKRNGNLRKLSINCNGYYRINLCKNGKVKCYLVHRLVAISFIENTYNKKEVNHIDGVKTNNNLINLEWCTSSENTIHAYKSGLKSANKGSKCNWSILKEYQVVEIKHRINIGLEKLKDIAIDYNVDADTISNIKRGTRWKHI